MMKKIVSVVSVILLLCALCTTAFAHPVPDLTKTGTVTVTMKSGTTAVGGGTLTAIRIGEVYEDDGDFTFRPTGAFASYGDSFGSLTAPETAAKVAEFAAQKSLTGTTKTIGADGKVVFEGLELGLYLFVQNQAASGYNAASPFIMGVPQLENNAYVYEVDASPKVELTPAPTEPPTEPPTVPDIPQTGQLNWPVPLMAAFGVVLLLGGVMLCFRGKKERYEE